MKLLDTPLASCELLAVDTETNGLAGDDCEMTEVGAVLVGGGEVHESWESLVRVGVPLRRGIQRFTGISQAMLDAAPAPEEVLPRLAERMVGRVLVAHNARFDERVLRQAFDRCGLDWPEPPTICTVALARKFAPLARRRGLAPLAESLGVEVGEVHRALPDALTCARVLCALFPRLCATAATVGEALELLGPRRRRARHEPPRRPPAERPDLSSLPTIQASTSSETNAAGRCTWASQYRFGPAPAPTSARPPDGRSGPRSWTTVPPTPSSARSCWRTG